MARSMIPPAFFSPPSLAEVSRPPDWVLVDKMAYIAKRENETTMKAPANGGDMVEVSFCLADPPAISYMCVHCPGLVGFTDSGFFDVPTVVSAEGAFVLLEISLTRDHGRRDYFVYNAGTRKRLSCLPNPFPHDISPWEIGILPLGGGDGNSGFIVAALVPRVESVINKTGPPFDLLLYSSGDSKWRTVVPQLDPSCKKVFSHSGSKVIVIGGGFLGWVDVWRGILLCNVLAEHPVLRLIPLPKPRISRTWKSNPEVVRGITSNGDNQLSFVEIQLPKFPSDDLLPSQYDSTLSDSDSDSDSGTGGPYYPSHGWKATTWKRTLFSPDGDQWSMDCTAGSDDILEGDPTCSALLPELWDAEDGRLSLMNLYSSAPVLSAHDEGVVYMISELLTSDGEEAWVAAFDLRNKRLKALGPFSSKRISSFENCCSPCSFSKYLREVPAGSKLSVDRISREPAMNFFVLLLLSIQDKLREFDESLAQESKRRPSLHFMRRASLLASIRAVDQCVPRDEKDKAICEAVAKCMRVLRHLKFSIQSESSAILPAERMDVLSSHIYMSHRAIDSLLQLFTPITSEESFRNRDACSSLWVEPEERIAAGLGPQLENTSISEYVEKKI